MLVPPKPKEFTETRRRPVLGQAIDSVGTLNYVSAIAA